MSTVMKASEFIEKLKDVATNYKTLYVMGCFGAPMTTANKKRWIVNEHYNYNNRETRTKMINAATTDTFGFDCVNLIKGILWGWNGDKTKTYGGAKYKSNGVPDVSADGMIKLCSGVTADFTSIKVGEAVWCKGHIGVYIGNGLAVECTPSWKNKVQITAVGNIGPKSGYNVRKWTKHGKFPYIEYDIKSEATTGKSNKTEEVCNVEVKVLKKGMRGKTVKALQALLVGYGYDCGSAGIDGSFGVNTDTAVRAYQKAKGLSVDGCVGPATWSALLGAK